MGCKQQATTEKNVSFGGGLETLEKKNQPVHKLELYSHAKVIVATLRTWRKCSPAHSEGTLCTVPTK